MTIVSKDCAQHYQWGQYCDGWHLVKTSSLSVIQEKMPPGSYESRHYHNLAEQFFFVISGTATIEINGDIHALKSMQGIHIAAGITHQISNYSNDYLEFLVTSTPPSHGDRFYPREP